MLFACKVNVRGMCVNKMDMCLSVLWSSALWVPFWLCLSNLNPWDLVTVLLSPPLATILWHASNPYPHSFFTHLPHPFPFSSLSLPLPFTSQLTTLVICVVLDTTDCDCHSIAPCVFTWDIHTYILFEVKLDYVCSPSRK